MYRKLENRFSKIDNTKEILPIKTANGTYTGTGAALEVNLGFKPTFVIVKSESTTECFWKVEGNWYERTESWGSFATLGAGISFTATGFSLGTLASVNTSGAVYHYTALADCGAEALIHASWQGNGASERIIDAFVGKKPRVILIKRDNILYLTYAVRDIGSGVDLLGAAKTAIISDNGGLTLGSDASTNQWGGAAGEGTTGFAFCDHPDIFFTTFTGVNAIQKITCPMDPALVIIFPLEAGAGSTTMLWMPSLAAGQHLPVGAGAVGTGRITSVADGRVTLPINNYTNAIGKKFGMLVIRKQPSTAFIPKLRPTLSKFIKINSGGYINCGNSNTLKFDGPSTLEWCGAIFPEPSDGAPFATGLGTAINNVAKKQIPLIFRSLGADTVDGSVSFGISVVAPRTDGISQGGSSWDGFTFVWATYNNWGLPPGTPTELDSWPAYSGVKMEIGKTYHVVLTHNGNGLWKLYLNGELAKERNRDLLPVIGKPNSLAGDNHYTVIGARRRGAGTFDHASCEQHFSHARVYNKELTAQEVLINFNAHQVGSNPVPGFLEEWHVDNASGTILTASNSIENNGVLVSCNIIG